MLPQAGTELPSGSRIPVMLGSQRAAWVTMPEPSRKAAYVSDEKALLAWAEKQYPEKVTPAETVPRITEQVLAVLREHLPGAIETGRQVDPQWVSDIQLALKLRGHYVTGTGEKLTEVPGITLPVPDPAVPRVDLADDATAVIGAAWPQIAAGLPGLLALPAGMNGEAPQ
jgi:hypothetical protein